MALANLPCELLDIIVEYSLPQSFENLAMTCKKIYARCTPFIKRYNKLRFRFRDFYYYTHRSDELASAFDLISLIAADPTVARYIKSADLRDDSRFLLHLRVRAKPPKSLPSIEAGGAIVQLFANSAYLRQAQLDWREYYSTFAEDVKEMRYSQHGCAFLLTLLGDTESVFLPHSWTWSAATKQLFDVVANEARQPHSLSSGLRSVTRFVGSPSNSEIQNRDSSWAWPFFALPQLKSITGLTGAAVVEKLRSLPFEDSSPIGEALEVADLGGRIDDVGITKFLKHTPRLKTLRYGHYTRDHDGRSSWDICKFLNAIAREAGSHLMFLEVDISEGDSILPGKASVRNFQKLKKFEYPLKLATCNRNAAGVTGYVSTSLQHFFNGSHDAFVRDLIPTSVTHLSLRSDGMGPYDRGLEALFQNLRAIRRSQLPNLEEVYISCKQEADEAYKQQCNKIVAKGRKVGVAVHLHTWDQSPASTWDV